MSKSPVLTLRPQLCEGDSARTWTGLAPGVTVGPTAGFGKGWFRSCSEQQRTPLPQPKQELQSPAACGASPPASAAPGAEEHWKGWCLCPPSPPHLEGASLYLRSMVLWHRPSFPLHECNKSKLGADDGKGGTGEPSTAVTWTEYA